jgi:hypothetical protein
MEEVPGFHTKPLNAAIGRALAPIGFSINRTCLPLFQGYISSSNC